MNRADAGDTAGIAPENRSLSLDSTFNFLKNEARRAALACLIDANHGVFVDELVDRVGEATGKDDDSVAIALHHVHLPKLEDHGVVEWDREHSHVEPTARLAELEAVLE